MIAKAEIHSHIEGTAAPELVLSQAEKYGVNASSFVDLKRGYLWTDFTSFLRAYDFVASLFRTPEDYIQLAEDYFLSLDSQGAIYAEIFVSPDHATRIGCSYNTLIDAICEGISSAKIQTGIEGRIIVVGVRHSGIEAVVNAAELATQNPNKLVTGFGMAGDERFGTQSDFAKAFEIAKDGGLHLTTHAGEFCGPHSVLEAIDVLQVERIGHGVRAIEDPALVERLADMRIPLEICPASNISLGVYGSIEEHPLKALKNAGVVITLNSDDPPHFHSSLENEYALAKKVGFTDADLLQCTRNAIQYAFIDDELKQTLLAKCETPD